MVSFFWSIPVNTIVFVLVIIGFLYLLIIKDYFKLLIKPMTLILALIATYLIYMFLETFNTQIFTIPLPNGHRMRIFKYLTYYLVGPIGYYFNYKQIYSNECITAIESTLIFIVVFYPLSMFFNHFMRGIKRLKTGPYLKVCERAYEEIKEKAYLPKKLKFYKTREEDNAFVFASKKVAIGENLLEEAVESEEGYEVFKGVLAHECGHIKNKDINGSLMVRASMVPIAGLVFLFALIVGIPLSFLGGSNKDNKSDNSIVLFFFGIAMLLISLVIRLASIIGGKHVEKRADLFAVKVGAGEGLLAFMKYIESLGCEGKLLDEHPVTRKRIIYIEEALKKQSELEIEGSVSIT